MTEGSPQYDPKTLSILYKRKGNFDTKREELLKTFKESSSHDELLAKVEQIVSDAINKDPKLLLKNKGQLAALIEGSISRSDTAVSTTPKKTESQTIEIDSNINLYDIFDEQVKQITIGSQQLKQDIRSELESLSETK